MIGGKPMVQHVYERTCAVRSVDRALVATDDERVAAAVRGFGGEVVMTRATHLSGTDRIAEVAAGLNAAVVLNVQGDLPFLDPGMVEVTIAPLLADETLPMATAKTAIRTPAEMANPNVVKVVTTRSGDALYFSRSPLPFWRDGVEGQIGFRHIGLYAYRREFLLHFAQLAPTPLEHAEKLEQLRALEWGYRIRVAETDWHGIEVDTPDDLEHARAQAAG